MTTKLLVELNKQSSVVQIHDNFQAEMLLSQVTLLSNSLFVY